MAYTKIAFVGDSISGLVLDGGPVGAASEEFIKDISGMHLATGAAAPLTTDDAEAAGMTKKFDGSTAVAAVFTKSGGTQLALLTAGEIWIYLDIGQSPGRHADQAVLLADDRRGRQIHACPETPRLGSSANRSRPGSE